MEQLRASPTEPRDPAVVAQLLKQLSAATVGEHFRGALVSTMIDDAIVQSFKDPVTRCQKKFAEQVNFVDMLSIHSDHKTTTGPTVGVIRAVIELDTCVADTQPLTRRVEGPWAYTLASTVRAADATREASAKHEQRAGEGGIDQGDAALLDHAESRVVAASVTLEAAHGALQQHFKREADAKSMECQKQGRGDPHGNGENWLASPPDGEWSTFDEVAERFKTTLELVKPRLITTAISEVTMLLKRVAEAEAILSKSVDVKDLETTLAMLAVTRMQACVMSVLTKPTVDEIAARGKIKAEIEQAVKLLGESFDNSKHFPTPVLTRMQDVISMPRRRR
jgi:hypothetical protein